MKKNGILAVAAAAFGLFGCADKTVAQIAIEALPPLILDGGSHALSAKALNKAGEGLPEVKLTYAAVPSDVIAVDSAGSFRCLKSGEATLTVAGGGQNGIASIKCRVVTRVEAPKRLKLIVKNQPVVLNAKAYGSNDEVLSDVPIEVTSSDTRIVTVSKGAAEGHSVGKAVLNVTGGGSTAEVPVEVHEKVVTDTLAIEDGAGLVRTLSQGNYLVEVEANAGGQHGVTLKWVGADCAGGKEQQKHSVRCTVDNTATLTVNNPSLLGMGASAVGFLNIYQVP